MLSFIIFLYADGLIQWTTGDDSGGTNGLGGNAATVGYDDDGANFFTVPGSGTSDIINITQTSNVGIPGMWMFITATMQGVVQRIICIKYVCIVLHPIEIWLTFSTYHPTKMFQNNYFC